MHRWQKIALVCGGSVILVLLFVVLILPGILKGVAERRLAEATGRSAGIGRVSLNPFTLTAEIHGFRLAEKGAGTPFLSFSSARLSVSPTSLVRRALILRDVRVTSPYLHVARTGPNTYNFSDLLRKRDPANEPARFSLNNIVIDRGALDFDDQALRNPARHAVRGIELAIPFISNIPYLAERYVEPRFRATIDGAPLALDGKLRPFATKVEYSLDLHLNKVDLPAYHAYLPADVAVQVRSGTLATALSLLYRISATEQPEVEITGDLQLSGLAVTDRAGKPLLALPRGEAKIQRIKLLQREFTLASLSLAGLELSLVREPDGRWNLERLLERGDAPPGQTRTEEKGTAESPHPSLTIGALQLQGGMLHLRDLAVAGGHATDLTEIALALADFSTVSGQQARLGVTLASGRGERLVAQAGFTVKPLTGSGILALEGLPLEAYAPYLAPYLTAPLGGIVDASATVHYGQPGGLVVTEGAVTARRLSVVMGEGEGLRLGSLELGGVGYAGEKRRATLERMSLRDGALRFSRDEDGSLSLRRLIRQQPATAQPRSAGAGAPPFSYTVRRATGAGLEVSFADRSRAAAPRFQLNRLAFSLADLKGPSFAGAMPATLSARYGERGEVRVSGTVTPQPFAFQGELLLRGVPLQDFDAYLPETFNVFIAEGIADARLTLALASAGEKLSGSFRGSAGVRGFYCLDTQENEDLLKWESLQLDGIDGALSPFRLGIRDVALSNVYSRIVVNRDRTLNLQHLVTKEPAPATEPAAAAPPAPPAGGGGQQVTVDTVTIQNGTLAFTDRHLPREYSTTFYNLGGRVSGLSSAADRFAEVDLRGNLENHSPLLISGRINPLRDDLFVDLKVSFTDIELSPLSPYSGTYLGYVVDKGKLFIETSYRIDKKQLESSNKVFIDQFTFGERVESDKATSLPVRLAVALLKDRNGEIHLDLPVAGRTDDPTFNYWAIILQILRNIAVKAATAPFALLGSLFGGGEDFSAVPFAAGSARLAPAEEDKLRKLAQALRDRPGLKLEISGYVDRERDLEGFRHEQLQRKLKAEKFLAQAKAKKNQPGETPETMEVRPEEYHGYLTAVYRKESFPKPRNALGLVKDLPDPEMEKLILANIPAGDPELRELAKERAKTVRAFLIEPGGLGSERLFLKGMDIDRKAAKEGVTGSRVEFGAAAL